MKISNALFINQVAQGVRTRNDSLIWFRQQPEDDRAQILRDLQYLALQAAPRQSDGALAVQRSGLKPTFTPCVLLRNGVLKKQVSKVINLPKAEQEKCFLLLLALFSVADERRRMEVCKGSCSHWWHKDISDESVINSIIEAGSASAP